MSFVACMSAAIRGAKLAPVPHVTALMQATDRHRI